MKDDIIIDVLPDGSVKITTSGISAPNHMSADQLLREIEGVLGGETKKEKRAKTALTATKQGTTLYQES